MTRKTPIRFKFSIAEIKKKTGKNVNHTLKIHIGKKGLLYLCFSNLLSTNVQHRNAHKSSMTLTMYIYKFYD